MLSPSEFVAPLKLIATLVNEMEECDELCKHVHARLVVINDKLLAMEKQKTLPQDSVVRNYGTLVHDFKVFLTKHKSRLWVYRIVTTKRVLGKVKTFQERITTLLLALNVIHIGAMAEERAIAARLTADATVATAVGRVEEQFEALSVLVHELEKNKVSESSGATPASAATSNERLLTTALDKVIRRSSVNVRAVPVWFCAPHDVEFDVRPFAGGSFGSVHHGRMNHMDVVVKRLLVDTRTNEVVTKRFREEASLWFGFRHRHVLMMYGACDVSSPPFIVCELAASGNLFNYLSFESNHPHMLRLLHEAASGLAYLHANRVVHGDLKGDNILVSGDKCAKVADFSFSYVRAMSASRNSVARSSAGGGSGARSAGAVRWRAPECLNGRSPTFASDVFSFGMCILEVVSQEVPWGYRVDDDTVRFLVMAGKLPEQPEGMASRIWSLVTRMCSLDPENRPCLTSVMEELGELVHEDNLASAAAAPPKDNAPTTSSSSMSVSVPVTTNVGVPTAFVGENSSAAGPGAVATPSAHYLPVDVRVMQQLSPLWNRISLLPQRQSMPSATSTPARTTTTEANMAPPRASGVQQQQQSHAVPQSAPSTAVPRQKTLEQAIEQDDVASVTTLLSSTGSLEVAVSGWNVTPLIVAAATGAVKVTQLLLARGANSHALTVPSPKLQDVGDIGCTAVHIAAIAGHSQIVKVLLTAKRDLVGVLTAQKRSAMYFAAQFGHAAVIDVLLQLGADAGVCDATTGKTALCVAAQFGQLESVRALRHQHQENVHAKFPYDSTPLHLAAENGHAAVIEELLQCGARIEETDTYRTTPLHQATSAGHLECVRVLLQHNANIHAKNCRRCTPLHEAAGNGHASVVDELLRNGAHIEEMDNMGYTPLHCAASNGRLECVRVLLQHNADVRANDDNGFTPLRHAVFAKHDDIAQLLRAAGVT